ncbi:unnamed protein product [Adineta ricciae]|uniref:PKD/REJ-like domain-containing protein n=1 Tax=Adineta ricciae TaxID=249248 RepID=A0A814QKB0_ADIRI|nr:unnamed protein product [Adineta ricciae]CAF1121474.1 unnamed protein product [Adineta ricciae]
MMIWTPVEYSELFGSNTENLTIPKMFFQNTSNVAFWRFQVFYNFSSEIIVGTFDIEINKPPTNGTCSIQPQNGTIMTLFTINCSDWYDRDGIKQMTIYNSKFAVLATTTDATAQLRLPIGLDQDLHIHIQDAFDCIAEFTLSSIFVLPDLETPNDTFHRLFPFLANNTDRNVITQIITSLSELLNTMNDVINQQAALYDILLMDISVTPLITTNSSNPFEENVFNRSIITELNEHASFREALLVFLNNQSTTTINDLQFQSSILSSLTTATNELTRKSSILASTKCQQLAEHLNRLSKQLPVESVRLTATHLAECSINALTASHAPLLSRMKILDLDMARTDEVLDQCRQTGECDWMDSMATREEGNSHIQRELSNAIFEQTVNIISLLTSSLTTHLNIDQAIEINSSSVYFSLENVLFSSTFKHLKGRNISEFQSESINLTEPIYIRKIIHPLAFSNQSSLTSNTNLSRMFSLSIINRNGSTVNVFINGNDSFEFFILRDPNMPGPSRGLQNALLVNRRKLLFNYHSVDLIKSDTNLTYSIHLEISPLNRNLSYVLIYKFNERPQVEEFDGMKILCYQDLRSNKNYTHFIDNTQTLDHQSIVYGIRELTVTQMDQFCSNQTYSSEDLLLFDTPVVFSDNYELLIYQAGCFYLDDNNNWQSNGLIVGPSTTFYETQCFTTVIE